VRSATLSDPTRQEVSSSFSISPLSSIASTLPLVPFVIPCSLYVFLAISSVLILFFFRHHPPLSPFLFSCFSSSSFSSYSFPFSLQSPNPPLVLINVLTRTVVLAGSAVLIQKLASQQIVLFIRLFIFGGLFFINLSLF
jgi:hypothetical protein